MSRSTPETLACIPLFSHMDDEERAKILAIMTERVFQPGQSAMEAGEPGTTFQIIEEGEAEIWLTDTEGKKIVLDVLEFREEIPVIAIGRQSECRESLLRPEAIAHEPHTGHDPVRVCVGWVEGPTPARDRAPHFVTEARGDQSLVVQPVIPFESDEAEFGRPRRRE